MAAIAGFYAVAVSGCTLTVENDCSSDADCPPTQYCARGGGILVRDGVCVGADVGIPDMDADSPAEDIETNIRDDVDGGPGCFVDEDCAEVTADDWSDCEPLEDICSDAGQRSRTVTTFVCDDGYCQEVVEQETQSCQREPDGSSCDLSDPCVDGTCEGGECVSTVHCAGTALDCGCETCSDCSADDDWYDIGETYPCCDGDSVCQCLEQEARTHFCDDYECDYEVTDERIVTDGCTPCSDAEFCEEGVCLHPYVEVANEFDAIVVFGLSVVDGEILDASGNAHHGTFQGGTQWNSTGGPTDALAGYLHHDHAGESYTEIAHHSDLDVTDGFTIAYWRRRHTAPTVPWESDVAKGNDTFQMRTHEQRPTQLNYTLRDEEYPGQGVGETDTVFPTPIGTVDVGTWHFVVFSFDLTEETAAIYVDDMESPVATAERSESTASNTVPLMLGAWNSGTMDTGPDETGRFASVDITGFSLFEDVLDAAQRTDLMDAGK